MDGNTGNRKLIVLSVTATEYLVQGEGPELDIRNVVQNMIPKSNISLRRLSESDAAALQDRLKPAQSELLGKFRAQKPAPAPNVYLVQLTTVPSVSSETGKELTSRELDAVAGGSLAAFDPQISQVNRPLIGSQGPVSVMVGIGIAGKF
jgi:hypothetical protein